MLNIGDKLYRVALGHDWSYTVKGVQTYEHATLYDIQCDHVGNCIESRLIVTANKHGGSFRFVSCDDDEASLHDDNALFYPTKEKALLEHYRLLIKERKQYIEKFQNLVKYHTKRLKEYEDLFEKTKQTINEKES